ncbi:SagB/ThcOx family dehydrogenase [Paenibacillus wynnii]|uniref:Nitroreductase domain-containing protein n=1 Tax=Paenibacillus wynnii TaxID=268407 RepID=A0A098MB62_9BACL|nr:SagB/ThcOx family dehydrogenase [Paenibacillus wynnii]KGE19790.1 hypothetical protein PWYN_10910 [Paenibacillus wynnii]
MNKSRKHYINVGQEGKPIQFVKIKDRRLPILTEVENEGQFGAMNNVEKTLRFHQIYNGQKAIRIANFIYSLLKNYNEDMEMEDINHIIEQSIRKLEIVRTDTAHGGLPIFLLRSENNLEEQQRYLLKRNEDIVMMMDSNTQLAYGALILQLEESVLGQPAKDMEWASNLFSLANPGVLLLDDHNIVEKELSGETQLTRLYHENTKLHSFHQQGDFMKPLDEMDEEIKKLTSRGRKVFMHKQSIPLPIPTKQSSYSIEEVAARRRSLRDYAEEMIDMQTLSNILHYSYGVTGRLKNTDLELRAVPSGGGLYPIDIFLSINHVDNLEPGIYYYDPLYHQLVRVNDNDIKDISKEVSGYSVMLENAAFTVILAANFWRNQWKYHERGYRVILLDCGHLAQNIHLMCTAYDLGSCCLMGFVDDEINKLIEVDGIIEHSMYLITVGHKKKG